MSDLAIFWAQATPGTRYWRLEAPAYSLPGRVESFNDIRARQFQRVPVIEDDLVYPYQSSVWQFPGSPQTMLMMGELTTTGRQRVLVEVDDNYLIPPHVMSPGIKEKDRPWKFKHDGREHTYSHEGHRFTVENLCDGIIASTETLAEIYSKVTNVPIYVCPNSVELDLYPEVVHGDVPERPQRFLYAASASHLYDWSLAERGCDWVSRKGGELWLWGLKPDTRVEHQHMPWVDSVQAYHHTMGVHMERGDVGICPLKRSLFHDAKSDIKAIEYTLSGALPIVQGDAPPYADWVDVVPSAVTEKDWEKQIKWALANRDEVGILWEKAYEFVMETKLMSQHIHKWREAVGVPALAA